MDYVIVSDMSLDIEHEFIKTHDIKFIPMEYVLGEDTFQCKGPESDEMMHNFYEKLREEVPTHTSQIVPNNYVEFFTPFLEQELGILYLSLSSGLSDTFSSANVARQLLIEEFPDAQIEIVDTLGATGGMGLLAESAFCNKEKGMTLSQNAQWLRDHVGNVNYWFRVDDLMYLKRGGRISAATAIVGTALNIKPVLAVDANGKLGTVDKKRGARLASKRLVELFEEHYMLDSSNELYNVVYINCADCIDDANQLKEMLLERHSELKIRVTMLSPIIGAHTGPDVVTLVHYGLKRTMVLA